MDIDADLIVYVSADICTVIKLSKLKLLEYTL